MYNIRNVTENDSELLRCLASKCAPLDLHTPYTYWVAAGYFGKSSFILEHDGEPIGFIMAIETSDVVFIWQIGLLSKHRGKALSNELFSKCFEYAQNAGKNIEATIAKENKPSYNALRRACENHHFTLEKHEEIVIHDIADNSFEEKETRYRIITS
jgi:diaminobutyrate acetyltransferase